MEAVIQTNAEHADLVASVAPSRWPRWPTSWIVGYLAFVVALVAVSISLDLAAYREQRLGMAFLQPLIASLVANGATLRELTVPARWILPGAGLLLLLYLLFSVVPWLKPRPWEVRPPNDRLSLRVELVCLVLLTLVVVIYRFYALNWIPNDFIGELVFQVVCTSDWRTLLSVSGGSGTMAPWAPIGLLHYLLTGAMWRLTGSTALTLCLASAVASVFLFLVLYGFVRQLGGPFAALIAAGLYAASPLEMVWGRHSMQPFNYPSIFVLLPAWTTYLAITRYHLRYWLLTVLLMALSHQSFGSAYAGFLVPIGVVGWLLLFDRARLWRCGWKPLLLVPGVVLWLLGPALSLSAGAGEWSWISPMDPRLGSRAFRGEGWSGSFNQVIENLKMVVDPLYVGKRGDTHQTPTSVFQEEYLPFLSPVATILFTAGFVWMLVRRRQPEVAVLVSLIVAALVPGLISYADPHRQAALYPALCAIAGCTAAAGLARLRMRFPNLATAAKVVLPVAVLTILFARSGAAYFARGVGEPPSVTITRTIKDEVSPGTLLVLHLPYSLAVDVAYLLFDDSLVEPFGWMFIDEPNWSAEVENFRPRFAHLFHVHTKLRDRVPELEKTEWKRIVFVIGEELKPTEKVEMLKRKFGTVAVKEVRPPTWRGEGEHKLTFVSVLPTPGARTP